MHGSPSTRIVYKRVHTQKDTVDAIKTFELVKKGGRVLTSLIRPSDLWLTHKCSVRDIGVVSRNRWFIAFGINTGTILNAVNSGSAEEHTYKMLVKFQRYTER